MAENDEVQGYGQTREPSPALRALDRLVGTWELSGDVGGPGATPRARPARAAGRA